ncbi:MAG TPA: cyclophilin-like fold protein [Draconibacterium sp.]|nr:cyclophilin-like fold protein [Draconibacterium sp.]
MNIEIGDTILTATLVDNSSVAALKTALAKAPITVEMRDYGNMEKVGSLGQNLPRNDEPITTEAGDIILYQGNALVIYYASNSWSFTRLGKINNITPKTLKDILGEGNVTITLSLPED